MPTCIPPPPVRRPRPGVFRAFTIEDIGGETFLVFKDGMVNARHVTSVDFRTAVCTIRFRDDTAVYFSPLGPTN